LQTHALNTSTDTNLNHARANRIRNIYASLETRGALPVQAPDRSRDWESSNKSRSTELSSPSTRRQDGANRNILDESWINLRALNE
jgi:hypothetical protein